MTLHLENFGKIRHAEIELNGLTVIAGHNDTGKSTIGKALFAIVKSISEYPELYERIKRARNFASIFSLNYEALTNKTIQKNRELVNEIDKIQSLLFSLKNDDSVKEQIFSFDFYTYFKKIKGNLEKENRSSNSGFIERINELLDAVKELPAEQVYEEIIKYVFINTFEANINNSCALGDKATISYKADGEIISEISFINNKLERANLNFDKKNFIFGGTTYIDTPLYLEGFHLPRYIGKSLEDKLIAAGKNFYNENPLTDKILRKIEEIFNGAKFSFRDKKYLEYRVNEEAAPLRIFNIASGEKAFGLLYVLLKGEQLGRNSIIILDEPENHLHPAWQIKYAELLALMVKEGYYILLTSHSPFFLQALKLYADKYDVLDDRTHFYLSEKEINDSNYSTIRDVTEDTEELFANLAAPLNLLFEVD